MHWIEDKNFLSSRNMPPMKNNDEVLAWLADSNVMCYVFGLARTFLIFDYDAHTWRGINYGKTDRVLPSKKKGIKRRTKRNYELFERAGIDLVEPCFSNHRISDWENFSQSAIIQRLKQEKDILRHIAVLAIAQKHILTIEREGVKIWQGADW